MDAGDASWNELLAPLKKGENDLHNCERKLLHFVLNIYVYFSTRASDALTRAKSIVLAVLKECICCVLFV